MPRRPNETGAVYGEQAYGAQETHDGLRLWFIIKASCVYLLLIIDCIINSMAEFNDFSTLYGALGFSMSTTSVIMSQLALQFAEMLTLFTMMGATYLFSNGLLSILFSNFKHIFIVNPMYLVYTFALGCARTLVLEGEESSTSHLLWSNPSYTFFSICHKLAAACYFMINIRAVRQLGEPKYYTKDSWVAVYKHSRV